MNKNTTHSQFAERLAALLRQKNISAEKVSLELGKNRNYLTQLLNQKSYPSFTMFFELCVYLNVTPSSFFNYTNYSEKDLRIQEIVRSLEHFSEKELQACLLLVKQYANYSILARNHNFEAE